MIFDRLNEEKKEKNIIRLTLFVNLEDKLIAGDSSVPANGFVGL